MQKMSVGRLGLRGCVLAGIVIMGVVYPRAVSADDIRIFLAVSRDPGVDAQVRQLERAIAARGGPLAIAESLSEAHVVIQFTEYWRTTGTKGEPLFHWAGHAKLLKLPEEMTVSRTPLPERFGLLAIGEDPNKQLALNGLERMLSRTLRPRARKPSRDAI